MRTNNELTVDRVNELLSFNPETGVFRWLVSRGGVKVGAIAGGVQRIAGHDYRIIKIDGRSYTAGRLAFLVTYGRLPKVYASPLNQDRLDATAENMIEIGEATRGHRGGGRRATASAGLPRGVRRSGKRFTAYASGTYLGTHRTAEHAHRAYQRFVKQLHGVAAVCN